MARVAAVALLALAGCQPLAEEATGAIVGLSCGWAEFYAGETQGDERNCWRVRPALAAEIRLTPLAVTDPCDVGECTLDVVAGGTSVRAWHKTITVHTYGEIDLQVVACGP